MSDNYIFPSSVADKMAKIDQATQYEATMLSMFFMMIGLVLSVVYVEVYLNFKLWFKIVTAINGFFGLLFMFAALVTAFQQYRAFKEFKNLQSIVISSNPVQAGTDNIQKEVTNK